MLRDRHRFARNHRFVDSGDALEHDAVDRNGVAGTDAEPIAGVDMGERDFLVGAVGSDAAGGFRGEVEQRANGAAGLLARTQFQDLAEQHEHHDDGSGLEIDRNRPVSVAEAGGEDARGERGDDAVEPGCACAERDQGEHVEAAVDDRVPAAPTNRGQPTQRNTGVARMNWSQLA